MRISRLLRFPRESPLPQGQVYLLKIAIGLLPIAGSHLAQAFHQSILRGAEESFHPPLGLRRVGRDPLDVELLQRPPDLRGLLRRRLAVMYSPGRRLKQTGFVGLHRQWPSVRLHIAA
jgi:hypothetical protein